MAESATERAARVASEKAARKAAVKPITVRQAALAMLHNHIKSFTISDTDLKVFMRKTRATANQVTKANQAVEKTAAKFISRLARVAGEENVR